MVLGAPLDGRTGPSVYMALLLDRQGHRGESPLGVRCPTSLLMLCVFSFLWGDFAGGSRGLSSLALLTTHEDL